MPISLSDLGGGGAQSVFPENLVVSAKKQFAVSIPSTGVNFVLGRNSLFGNGMHRFRFFPTGTSQPTITMHEINSSYATIGSAVTFSDADTGNNVGFVERWYSVSGSEVGWNFNSNQVGYLVVEKIDIPEANTRFSILSTATSSGEITFSGTTTCVLFGAGGSGGASSPATGGQGTGGGGSGYQVRFSAPAGSYTFVAGAGGTGGGDGGSSTFAGNGIFQTASGGSAGTVRANGGNGGSGGGGGSPLSGDGWSGGGGGSNGGNGGTSPNGSSGGFSNLAGVGSGVTYTGYLPGMTAGAGGNAGGGNSGGGGGGLYAGGGGGGGGVNGSGGNATQATGGGGGKSGTGTGTPGSGGSGMLLYMRGL